MEFQDALKSFRRELGLAQTDIAAALHINVTTVGRWEQGKTAPSRSFAVALLAYAKSRRATGECINNLEEALNSAAKQKLFNKGNGLFSVERDTISQLIDDASFPIYVCDIKTDEILYVNRATEHRLGESLGELVGAKCYERIMHRDAPCEFCHKHQLVPDSFSCFEAFRHFDGNYYRVLGKLVKWNGRDAQVRYAFELGGSVNVTSKNELLLKYNQQIELRRQFACDALAVAHYNLTCGTVAYVKCKCKEIEHHILSGRYEDVIRALSENNFTAEEKNKFDSIRDSRSLIKLFFQGKTHISIRHRIKGMPGYYEGTLDLLQNPLTSDIEAFSTLRDITEETISRQILSLLISRCCESVFTIDAATGTPRPYHGGHLSSVIDTQTALGDNIAGVEAYLRKHCIDSDIERVIHETSLPYVKEQLKIKPVLTVAYSLCEGGKIIRKQTRYSYLDEEQATILCVMQDLSEAYKQFSLNPISAQSQGAGLCQE